MAEMVFFKEKGRQILTCVLYNMPCRPEFHCLLKPAVSAATACGGLRCFVCWRLEVLSVRGNID